MRLAHWFKSRGRLGCFCVMLPLCVGNRPVSSAHRIKAIQTGPLPLMDNLEAVIFRGLQNLDNGVVNDISKGLAVRGRFALDKVDAREGHAVLLWISGYSRR